MIFVLFIGGFCLYNLYRIFFLAQLFCVSFAKWFEFSGHFRSTDNPFDEKPTRLITDKYRPKRKIYFYWIATHQQIFVNRLVEAFVVDCFESTFDSATWTLNSVRGKFPTAEIRLFDNINSHAHLSFKSTVHNTRASIHLTVSYSDMHTQYAALFVDSTDFASSTCIKVR